MKATNAIEVKQIIEDKLGYFLKLEINDNKTHVTALCTDLYHGQIENYLALKEFNIITRIEAHNLKYFKIIFHTYQ